MNTVNQYSLLLTDEQQALDIAKGRIARGWSNVGVKVVDEGYIVTWDSKPINTPTGRSLHTAGEW